MHEPLRPCSHVLLFGNAEGVNDLNAPAAMYFVISVLPISMTSGASPPASAASNFVRWLPHVWYCTSTLTPGCFASNAWFAVATAFGQPFWASTWSQTVSVVAFAVLTLPLAVE